MLQKTTVFLEGSEWTSVTYDYLRLHVTDARKLSAQISPGTVVAILNASIMPKRDGKSDLAICINNSAQLIEIGFAEDAGSCKGEAKGGSCKNLVNKSKSEYCMYHLRAALQKNGSHRMDLQSNWSGVEPKLSRIGKAADGVFYGGQMFAAPNAPAEQKKVSQKPLGKPIGKEAQARIEEGRNLMRKQFTDPEKKVLDNMTTENNELNRFVTADGPGSRNLVRSFTSDDFRSRPRQLISPSQALRNEQTSMQKLLAEQKQLALAKCSTAPQLGRSEASDDVIVIGARKKPANSSQVTGKKIVTPIDSRSDYDHREFAVAGSPHGVHCSDISTLSAENTEKRTYPILRCVRPILCSLSKSRFMQINTFLMGVIRI